MKKKITALLIAVCLLCVLFPADVFALEGVDYSRITSDARYRTVLQLGNLQFQGLMTKGTGLSQTEQDIIIAKVMDEQKITAGMLINAVKIMEDAQDSGFKIEDAVSAILKVTGMDTFVDLYKLFFKDGGADEVQNVLTNAGLKATELYARDISTRYVNVMVKAPGGLAIATGTTKAVTKTGFRLLFLIPDLVEVGLDVGTKIGDIMDKAELALKKKGMLDTFYAECNKRIAQAAGEGGEWIIRFNNAKTRYSFAMWGIPTLLSEWKLTGELVRQVTGAGENYGGTYQGLLMLEIDGIEMDARFDKQFKDREIFFNGGGAYRQGEKVLWANQGITISTVKDDFKTTTLKRTVSGELTVYVLEGSGEITPTVLGSLASASDDTVFSFEHDINGTGIVFAPGAQVNMVGSIKYISNDIQFYTYSGTKTANGYELVDDQVSGMIQTNLGTVWRPLGNEPKLTIYAK